MPDKSPPPPVTTCDQCRSRKTSANANTANAKSAVDIRRPPSLARTPVMLDGSLTDHQVRCNIGPPRREADPYGGTGPHRPGAPPPRQSYGQCSNCARRSERCTYDYQPKKPGRPRASRSARPSSQRPSEDHDMGSSPSPTMGLAGRGRPGDSRSSPATGGGVIASDDDLPALGGMGAMSGSLALGGPILGSIFGSARQTLQGIEFDYTIPATRVGSPAPHEHQHQDEQLVNNSIFPPPPLTAHPFGTTGGSSVVPPFGFVDVHPPPPLAEPAATMPMFDYPSASAGSVAGGGGSSVGVDPTLGLGKAMYSPSTTLGDLVTASDGVAGLRSDGGGGSANSMPGVVDTSRIENFATWEDIGFFLSLHMKHQHVLVPLVHRPSFAQDVLYRRDETDEAFRGLLLSMVAYTICQCPINWLVGRMDKAQLEVLLERCQRGSRVIQIQHQTRPSLVVLASTILDWITSQAAPAVELPANLMSDIRRLVYTLGLNREIPKEDLSPLELQLCRRLFWEAYANDKTNALNGHPMILHEMDGCPPLPLEIDDEYMTGDATFPQPPGRLSYMSGFCYVSLLFKVLNGCITRHRTLAMDDAASAAASTGTSAGVSATSGNVGPDRAALAAWVSSSLQYVQRLLAEMPEQLRPGGPSLTPDAPSVFGTQAANLCITALCTELALLDLQSKVAGEGEVVSAAGRVSTRRRTKETGNAGAGDDDDSGSGDSDDENDDEVPEHDHHTTIDKQRTHRHKHLELARHDIAQRAFRQLEHLPLECLASNGESLRGKVLRVILALLNVSHESESTESQSGNANATATAATVGEGLWDWWNIYSRVQFIQLLPESGQRAVGGPL